jgi:hypothetical protein
VEKEEARAQGKRKQQAGEKHRRRPFACAGICHDSNTVIMWHVKGYGVATLAQNKIFPAKQELLLSEITGLPLDAQMQRNRLDVDERVEGSRQCSC